MRPNIEYLKQTLKRGKAPYVPLIELGIHPFIKEKFLGKKIISLKDEVEFWCSAGYDYTKLQPEVDFNPQNNSNDVQPVFREDGTMTRKWAAEGKGVITSFEKFEQYKFPDKSDIDYTKIEEVKELLPEGMGVIGQYGDIFTMTWEMMGFEGFSYALFDQPDLIKLLNDKLGELVLSMFEYFAQSDAVDILWFSDDIAYTNALMMSPQVLHSYLFPWLKKIGDLARETNKPLLYHTDGILWDVFDDIIECGVDGIHPIEPKAMDIADVKKKVGEKLCLLGHIDVDLLCRGTEEEVRSQVRKNIEQAGYNGGYCVGSGNSVPEYVKFENYIAMIEETKSFTNNIS